MSLRTACKHTLVHAHTRSQAADGDQYIFIKRACHCKFLECIEWAECFCLSSIFMVMEIERGQKGLSYTKHTHTQTHMHYIKCDRGKASFLDCNFLEYFPQYRVLIFAFS